jgi:hypothetical protein
MIMKKYLLLSALLALVSVGAATKFAVKTEQSKCCNKQQQPTSGVYYENYHLVLIKYFY